MQTKIVYVITSSGEDIYVEQTYMSIWSCKYHNPDAKIVVVTDDDSLPFINKYNEINELTSELISISFDEKISKAERSRFLKTSLRSLVKGDFLYVDGDTIFCDSISEIDNFNFQIALVEDRHASSIYNNPFREFILAPIVLIFNLPSFKSKFYNGGVIYAKDNELAHDFFKEWHTNWNFSNKKTGLIIDQPALFQTYLSFKNSVNSLDGIYNAQIELNDKYLFKGKILHFFHGVTNGWHPFIDNDYYQTIKEMYIINEKIKNDILNCKKLYDFSYLTRRFSFLPKGLAKILRKINRFYKFKILSLFYYLYYKNFYKKYIKIKKDSKIKN